MLSFVQIMQLCCFSVLLSCGQVLFKIAALNSPTFATQAPVWLLVFNQWFIAAIMLYATATLLWVIILQTVPLSLAYPFVALGFIFVPLASYFLFNEIIGLRYVTGLFLILAGLFLIATAGNSQ